MQSRTSSTVPHRRYNALTGEWIVVSPHRAARPWLGAVEKMPPANIPAYDPKCYLCPGNTRVNGAVNPPYESVFVFDNDFPALLTNDEPRLPKTERNAPSVLRPAAGPESLLVSASESGVCRVICFSPRHDLTLAQLPPAQVRAVVDTWVAQCEELGARDDITYVQLFENRGEVMGASNPHPHGQLWANEHLPTEPAKEQQQQLAYLQRGSRGADEHGSGGARERGSPNSSWLPSTPAPQHPGSSAPMLLDYLEIEQREGERIIFQNDHFVCLVPYWAVWPFEVMLLPKQHIRRMVDMTPTQRDGLADALRCTATRYDNMFEIAFPYSMGVHQAPYDGQPHDEWQMHLHFYPPLLRSATVKKFMVGYEMLAQPQRDLTPEQAAERLRGLSEVRFA